MKKQTALFLALLAAPFGYAGAQHVAPNESARFINKVAPTTRPWHEADDSLNSVNTGLGSGESGRMIGIMKEGLLAPPSPLECTLDGTNTYVTQILEALCRSGNSPEITNALYQALVAPTNHYRDATLHACVMASPVPMTFLAETVVNRFPAEQRDAWYRNARTKAVSANSMKPPNRPSRAGLRFAHFLYTAKQLETDPGCLRIIRDSVDPERSPANP